MAHNYHKIQAPFKRLEGHKILSEEYLDEYVEMLKDIRWRGTEKVNGCNCNIVYDGNEVSYLGHTEKTSWHPDVIKWLEIRFVHNDAFIQMCEQSFGEKRVCFHGELIGPKILSNVYQLDDYRFILFDITIESFVMPYSTIEELGKTFNMETSPVRMEGTLKECVDYIRNRGNYSFLCTKTEIEGIVIRPENELFKRNGERIIYKIKIKDLCGTEPVFCKNKNV